MYRLARTLVALGVLALSASASAFVFYLTESDQPLRWKETAITVRASTVAPGELSPEEVDEAIAEAFATWHATGCVPAVSENGTTDATEAQLPPSIRGPADNIVVFIKTATHWAQRKHGKLEIAVTVIANNPETGEIVDADIEVNDAGFEFSVADHPGLGEVDFRSTLIHEVGHFYGLDHSLVRDATMFANYDSANPTGKRTLDADDRDGVCALYAIPFPPEDDDDCAGGGATSGLAAAIALLALRATRRRRAAVMVEASSR